MTARLPGAARALAPFGLLLAGACVSAPGGARAPIVTDRPDFTESAVAVPRGSVQVESGATYEEEAGAHVTSIGEILVRQSLGAGRELRVGVPTYFVVSPAGDAAGAFDVSAFGDANLGVKLELYTPGEGASRVRPAVGVIVGTSIPVGDSALRADDPEPEAKLLLAWDVGDRLALSSNLNWTRVSAGAESYAEPSASLSLGVAVTETVGSYLEAFAFAPSFDDAPRPAYLNGGLTWQLSPDFQLDARVGVGVNDAPDARFVGVGLSRRFW